MVLMSLRPYPTKPAHVVGRSVAHTLPITVNSKSQHVTITAVLSVCLLGSIFSANAFAEERDSNARPIKIEYNTKVAENSHYVQFKTCIGNKFVKTPTFTVTSDLDSKIIKFQKVQQANTCKSYNATINAKHFNSISIAMID